VLVVVVPLPPPPNPPNSPPPRPPNPLPPVKQPEGPAGSMSRELAVTTAEELLGPTAATQAPDTRSEAEPVVVVDTDAVLGTVIPWLEPLLGWTVTAVPLTAVTTPLTLAKSEMNPPEGRGAKVKLGRPPPKPPGLPPVNEVAGQAPLTSAETVTRLAVIVPEASLPVAVMQLPTVMSETLPVPVSLIGVELVKSTVTSPLEVLSTSVDPLRLAKLPSVRFPSRNRPYPPGAALLVVPQATISSPRPPRAATVATRARTRPEVGLRTTVRLRVASNLFTTPLNGTASPAPGGGAGRDARPAPPGREVEDR